MPFFHRHAKWTQKIMVLIFSVMKQMTIFQGHTEIPPSQKKCLRNLPSASVAPTSTVTVS